MLVNSSEQVLPAATDLHVGLVHSPGGRAVTGDTTGLASPAQVHSDGPTHDRRWFYLDAALLHHLRQIAIADPVLAGLANTHQDDLNRKTTAFEHGEGSSDQKLQTTPSRLMQRSRPQPGITENIDVRGPDGEAKVNGVDIVADGLVMLGAGFDGDDFADFAEERFIEGSGVADGLRKAAWRSRSGRRRVDLRSTSRRLERQAVEYPERC
jgi:hypothetical protein